MHERWLTASQMTDLLDRTKSVPNTRWVFSGATNFTDDEIEAIGKKGAQREVISRYEQATSRDLGSFYDRHGHSLKSRNGEIEALFPRPCPSGWGQGSHKPGFNVRYIIISPEIFDPELILSFGVDKAQLREKHSGWLILAGQKYNGSMMRHLANGTHLEEQVPQIDDEDIAWIFGPGDSAERSKAYDQVLNSFQEVFR